MKIALIEAFFSGSHKAWAEGLQRYSSHEIKIFSLPGKYWKWRMQGGAISLAKQLLDSKFIPDLILATDMLNLPLFVSLIKSEISVPVALYFHENQLAYPWSKTDPDTANQRDFNYHFINYSSALCADKVFFNSDFHRKSFFDELANFLRIFPDHRNLETPELLKPKSETLYLGLDLARFEEFVVLNTNEVPILLWNHRWEYDKNPESFFNMLFRIRKKGIPFQLVVLGEKYARYPAIFDEARERLAENILHFGYANSFDEYARWLQMADIYPVTSNQDFFGISVVEALYSGVIPLLPDRLAYPEHLPEGKEWCIYQNEKELEEKLLLLLEGKFIMETTDIRQYVSRYDWGNINSSYDKAFEQLVSSF